MQQYDMPHGNHFGSRLNSINMEAITISTLAGISKATSSTSQISRRCVLIKLSHFSLEVYRQLVTQYAGAIIILLPLTYNQEEKNLIKSFESQMLKEDVKIPIYFILESEEVLNYYDFIDKSSNSEQVQSAFKALLDSLLTNGFQFVINSPQSQPIVQSTNEYQAVNIQAKLNGISSSNQSLDLSSNKKIPTIIITAHYDAFGMATVVSFFFYKYSKLKYFLNKC